MGNLSKLCRKSPTIPQLMANVSHDYRQMDLLVCAVKGTQGLQMTMEQLNCIEGEGVNGRKKL